MNKQFLVGLWNKAVENKSLLIKVGSAVVGAVVALGIAAVAENAQLASNDEFVKMVLTDEDPAV